MENSEIQKQTVKLGRALVKQLGLKPGADTISRWMAYYIAEQMTVAKRAKGKTKTKVEQQCFEAILKLWQYRSQLPNGLHPYENFEPIFRALERLDPENTTPYFYSRDNLPQKDGSKDDAGEVYKWLEMAQGIDQAARLLLEYVFSQAAIRATDENTIQWLESAVGRSETDESEIIVRLIGVDSSDQTETNADQERQRNQEQLQSRIKQLDVFSDFSRALREVLVSELNGLIAEVEKIQK